MALHLTHEQLNATLAEARKVSQRDWLAILLSFNHALRISECCALTPQNFSSGFITIQRLKGSLKTVQPLLPNERTEVEAWLPNFSAHQRIFGIQRSMLSKLFERYARLAGVPQHLRHFHVLKASCAMHTIHGAGIENLRQYLGHKSISSTGAYLRVDDATAARAVQQHLCAGAGA